MVAWPAGMKPDQSQFLPDSFQGWADKPFPFDSAHHAGRALADMHLAYFHARQFGEVAYQNDVGFGDPTHGLQNKFRLLQQFCWTKRI